MYMYKYMYLLVFAGLPLFHLVLRGGERQFLVVQHKVMGHPFLTMNSQPTRYISCIVGGKRIGYPGDGILDVKKSIL